LPHPGEVTALLSAWHAGDRDALERLIPVVYEDLRRVAARYMRAERDGHTLQPTELVHEVYVRLIREQDRTWENRAHFFAVAAQMMRNLLVDHARAANREKRGGAAVEVALEDAGQLTAMEPAMILALDDALRDLAKVDPRCSRIVALRYFVGLSNEETAEAMGISSKTVTREWNTARLWLRAQMRAQK
jgi:RNA polymerase sigma factor (TIGR02999 family)